MRYVAYQFQRKIKLHKNRKKIASLLSFFSPKIEFNIDKSQVSELKEINKTNQVVNQLNSDGIVVFDQPFFSESEVKSIFKALENKKLFEPYTGKDGYCIDTIPSDCSCSHYERNDIVRIPEVLNLANDPGLLNLAKEFLGSTPTISNINLWWGTYRDGDAVDNELFHRDIDDYNFIKFFIYLTDTDSDDYNIVYVKNTLQSKEALSKIRYSDNEITQLFGADSIVDATGKAGTGFVAANYGVHKGRLPAIPDRKTALLQIQYSVRGIGGIDYEPVTLDYDKNKYIELNSWINRCLIK